MNNVTIQAALIAALAALVVALLNQVISVVNQILAHRLTVRREKQKYYNEVYQKLFAPIIPEIFTYIGMVSNFKRGHDTTDEQEIAVKNKVIDYVSNNLLYASPKLVTLYHEIDVARMCDVSGRNPLPCEIDLLREFVNEYEYVIRNTSIYNGKVQHRQLELNVKYKILYILLSYGLEDILAFSSWFDESCYTNKIYSKLYRILNESERRDNEIGKRSIEDQRKFRENMQDESEEKQSENWNRFMRDKHEEVHEKYHKNKKRLYSNIVNTLIGDDGNRRDVSRWIEATMEATEEELRRVSRMETEFGYLASIDRSDNTA